MTVPDIRCVACGKSQNEAAVMVALPVNGGICDECSDLISALVDDKRAIPACLTAFRDAARDCPSSTGDEAAVMRILAVIRTERAFTAKRIALVAGLRPRT